MVYGVWCMVYGVWCMVYGVNLPQMPPDFGGSGTGVDQRNHLFAPGLPPEWTAVERIRHSYASQGQILALA